MTTRIARRRSLPARPTNGLARPRELLGESFPELFLVVAVLAAVVSGVFALNGPV